MTIVYNKILLKRTMFFLLWLFLLFSPKAFAVVEIYANGQKYDSFEDYVASKKTHPLVQINELGITESTSHKMYVLGIENGVNEALKNFYQHWGQMDFQFAGPISKSQLQNAIKEEVTKSQNPKLLISEPGKLRIMSLTDKDVK